jgi:rhodanese-related sulfurtransferase
MARFSCISRLTLLAVSVLSQRTAAAFVMRPSTVTSTRRYKEEYNPIYRSRSSFSTIILKDITREDMEFILGTFEQAGRKNSGYIVLDVRGEDEVSNTGTLSPSTQTLPLAEILEGCFLASEEAFMEKYGFDKPAVDETLVFSCAAGTRARKAAEQALGAGYTKVVVYGGGANEWFAVVPKSNEVLLLALLFMSAVLSEHSQAALLPVHELAIRTCCSYQ